MLVIAMPSAKRRIPSGRCIQSCYEKPASAYCYVHRKYLYNSTEQEYFTESICTTVLNKNTSYYISQSCFESQSTTCTFSHETMLWDGISHETMLRDGNRNQKGRSTSSSYEGRGIAGPKENNKSIISELKLFLTIVVTGQFVPNNYGNVVFKHSLK